MSLGICEQRRPRSRSSLFANRIPEHRMYQWRANARIRQHIRGINLNMCMLRLLETIFGLVRPIGSLCPNFLYIGIFSSRGSSCVCVCVCVCVCMCVCVCVCFVLLFGTVITSTEINKRKGNEQTKRKRTNEEAVNRNTLLGHSTVGNCQFLAKECSRYWLTA